MAPRTTSSAVRSLNAGHDDDAAGYDAKRRSGWLSRRRTGITLGRLDATDGDVLEIGAGTGHALCELAGARPARRFVGIEPLPNYVDFAADRARRLGLRNVEFVVGTAESLPPTFSPRGFGLVLSTDTLHHIRDVRQTARQLAIVATPGAHWLVMEPNRLNLYMAAYHRFTAGERNFSVAAFLKDARAVGWQSVGRNYLFLIPGGVDQPPRWAQRIERRLEGIPAVGAGVMLDLVRSRD